MYLLKIPVGLIESIIQFYRFGFSALHTTGVCAKTSTHRIKLAIKTNKQHSGAVNFLLQGECKFICCQNQFLKKP